MSTSTDVHGRPGTSTDVHGRPGTSTDVHGRPRTSTDVHGRPRTSTDVHGRPRSSTDIHGHHKLEENLSVLKDDGRQGQASVWQGMAMDANNDASTPCGRAVCSRFLSFWTPYAVRLMPYAVCRTPHAVCPTQI
jgi:hypothetical protein